MDEKEKGTGRLNFISLPESTVKDFNELARARGFKTKNAFFITLVQEEKQRRTELLDLYQQQQELKKKMAAARQAAETE